MRTVSEIKAARGSYPPNFSASASACSFFSTPQHLRHRHHHHHRPFSSYPLSMRCLSSSLVLSPQLSIVCAVPRIMPPHTRSNAHTPRPAAAAPSRIPTTPENPAEPVNVSSNPTTPVVTDPAASSDMTPNAPPSDGISPNLTTSPADLPTVPRKRAPTNPLAAAAEAAASAARFHDRADPPGRVALQTAQGSRHQIILPSNFVPGSRPGTFKDLDAPQRRTSLPGGTLTIVLVEHFVKQPNGNGLPQCHSTSTWRYQGLTQVGMLLSQPTILFKLREFACPLGLKLGVVAGFTVATFRTSMARATWNSCALPMRGYTKPGWRRYFAVFPNGVGRRTLLPKHLTSSCCTTAGRHSMASTGPRTARYPVRMPVQNRASAIVGSVLGTIGLVPPCSPGMPLGHTSRSPST